MKIDRDEAVQKFQQAQKETHMWEGIITYLNKQILMGETQEDVEVKNES